MLEERDVPVVQDSRLMRLLKALGFFSGDKKDEASEADLAVPARSASEPPVAPLVLAGEPLPSPVLTPSEAALSLAVAKQASQQTDQPPKPHESPIGVAHTIAKAEPTLEPLMDVGDVPSDLNATTDQTLALGKNTLFNTRMATDMSTHGVFTRYLETKLAHTKTAAGFVDQNAYAGIGSPANLLIAGLGGYGGASLGRSAAGWGSSGKASRQLANVEQQLMSIAADPTMSGRQKRRLLAELNREAGIIGASRAPLPNTVGQAEAASRRMSDSLAKKITARRLPGFRGLGIVAGAAAPFILPDFLRNAGVIA
jgi:hypothetical protein